MLDRRSFLKLVGASGAAFLLPPPVKAVLPDNGGEGVFIDNFDESDVNCVTLTIDGLIQDTRYVVLDEQGNIIFEGVQPEEKAPIVHELPVDHADQQLDIRCIEVKRAQYVAVQQFVSSKQDNTRIHILQPEERNYHA